jgi:phage I-like protein
LCCEVSCDLVGLAATGWNSNVALAAMTKITTGLSPTFIEQVGMDALLAQFERQYHHLAGAVLAAEMGSHPSTPARLELMRRFCLQGMPRILAAQESIGEQEFETFLTQLFAETLGSIYPSLRGETENLHKAAMLMLCWAVAMADGDVDERELQCLRGLSAPETFEKLRRDLQPNANREFVDRVLREVVAQTKQAGASRNDAVRMLRQAALVAQSSGQVLAAELAAMYQFGAEFGISKHDILILARQRMASKSL